MRTIYRDLTTLEAAGFTIVYHADRQGYRLGRDCLLRPPQLDDREALALLIMSRLGGIPDPFGSLLPGRRALTKIIQALPMRLRNQLVETGELLPSDDRAAPIPENRQAIYEMILIALVRRQRLRLELRQENRKSVSTTVFDLYRLAWHQGQWALVGYCSATGGIRLYWLPWIEAVHPTSEAYAIPPRFNLNRFLKSVQAAQVGPKQSVHLRFSARAAPLICDMEATKGQRIEPAPDGTVDLFMTVDAVEQILNWVLGFGDQVQVIEPQELKAAVCDWASRIIRQYQKGPP